MGGIKTFGLTQLVVRTSGSVEEKLPCEIGLDGECKYVGPDDVDKVRIYHRNTGITTSRSASQGYGNAQSKIVNTYQLFMVVYIDHKRTKLYPEELFLYLQSNMPEEELKRTPYDKVSIRTTNVILNSQQIFQAEYPGTEFKLPPGNSLFQVNYTIETTHKKECFAKCPEDC